MKNTVFTLILGIDKQQLLRQICAESACVAFMSPSAERPRIFSPDNRDLLMIYIETAFVEFCSRFAAFIDPGRFSISAATDGVVAVPLRVPVGIRIPQTALRGLVEQMLVASVLSVCYEAQPGLSGVFADRRSNCQSRLLQLLAPPK